jgi:hypothetical protein
MKRVLICIFFLTTFAVFCLGQQTEENWQRFSPEREEFAVDTPTQLKRDGDKDSNSSRKYNGSINGAYLYVFSDPIKKKRYSSDIKRFLSDWGQATDNVRLDEQGSSTFSFKDPYGFWHHVVFVRTETRVYVAQTVSENRLSEIAARFIKSFGLGEKRFVRVEKEETADVKPAVADKLSTTPISDGGGKGSGIGRGSDIGSGSGPGSGSGVGPGAIPQPSPKQTSPLRILSKSRPAYTDLARFYEISGKVVARVTFLASGEVGAVSPTRRLPFGLTEAATAAAKAIRFSPAYLEGNPITVVKTVEFSFLLY